jgi:hypothetical protein
MARNSIPRFRFLVEYDARNHLVFERHLVEANNEDHALIMVRIQDPDLDWGSGRFEVRITNLGSVK